MFNPNGFGFRRRPGGMYGRGPRPRPRPYGGNGRGGVDPFLMMMLFRAVIDVLKMPETPKVSLILAGMQLLLFFKPVDLGNEIKFLRIEDVCIHPRKIVEGLQFSRVALGGFFHGDQYHCVYNMISLLQKGAALERSRGPIQSVFIFIFLYVLSNIFLVLFSLALFIFTPMKDPYGTCTVGFSGVLFALKVILTHNQSGSSQIMGFRLPLRYMAWAELLYIHFFVPRSSFLGHLAGIAAGFVFVNFEFIMKVISKLAESLFKSLERNTPPTTRRSQRNSDDMSSSYDDRYDSSRGRTDYSNDTHRFRSNMQQQDRRSDGASTSATSETQEPSKEDMRRARLRKFDKLESKIS